jgi:5-methylcytosine-specific restriction enzyme subunit McrC
MRFISACESDWLRVVEDLDQQQDSVLLDDEVSRPSRDYVGVISLAEARAIVSLKKQKIVDDSGLRGKGFVDEQKWAKLYDGKMQLGRYVGQISIGNLCIEIRPKIDHETEGAVVPLAPFVLFTTAKDAADALPTLGYDSGGVINESFFDYFAGSFIRQLAFEVSNGLRSGYNEIEAEVPTLRGRVLYARVPVVTLLRPHLLPCRFDNFTEDTLHNRILKQALRILTQRVFAPSLRQLGEELMARLANVSDTNYEWVEIKDVDVDRLQVRYSELIKHAKLTIRSHFAFISSPQEDFIPKATRGFVMIWDVERLYEKYAQKILSHNIQKGSGLKLLEKCADYSLAHKHKKPVIRLEPDFILCDTDGKVLLILDTKWKNFEEKNRVAREDAYQMMAYAQCLRKGLEADAPPVVLLYPSKNYVSSAENNKNTFVFTNLESDLMVRFLPLCLPLDKNGLIDYLSTDLSRVLGPEVCKLFKGISSKRRKRTAL